MAGLSLSMGGRSTAHAVRLRNVLHADVDVIQHFHVVGDKADGRNQQVLLARPARSATRSSICGPSHGTPVLAALW